jgi:hypothetical protein
MYVALRTEKTKSDISPGAETNSSLERNINTFLPLRSTCMKLIKLLKCVTRVYSLATSLPLVNYNSPHSSACRDLRTPTCLHVCNTVLLQYVLPPIFLTYKQPSFRYPRVRHAMSLMDTLNIGKNLPNFS